MKKKILVTGNLRYIDSVLGEKLKKKFDFTGCYIRYFKRIGKIIILTGTSNLNNSIKNNKRGINIHLNLNEYNQIESSHASILSHFTDRLKGRKVTTLINF